MQALKMYKLNFVCYPCKKISGNINFGRKICFLIIKSWSNKIEVTSELNTISRY